MYKHILLPTDGSDRSVRAIMAGIELAAALNAKVTGLFINESTYIPGVDEAASPRAEAALSVVAQRAKESGVTSTCVAMTGDTPQDSIIRFANENGCDLIVMGTPGRSRVGKFLLGSVAAAVLADSTIPVLLYR